MCLNNDPAVSQEEAVGDVMMGGSSSFRLESFLVPEKKTETQNKRRLYMLLVSLSKLIGSFFFFIGFNKPTCYSATATPAQLSLLSVFIAKYSALRE